MKKLCVLFLFVAFYPGFAQKDNRIIIGTVDSVYSNVLSETRRILVYVPKVTGGPPISEQKYPVIYLLDGDSHFHSVTGLIQQLSPVNGNVIFPEMIVVGIPNTDRTRDLTPTHSMAGTNGKEWGFLNSSGGGELFTSFLEKELIPYVEAHYPTAPHRMLIGHSFGGLMAINTLIHHPGLFNSYVAIDPSMWWDHQKLLNECPAVLQGTKLKGKSLFIGVANTMPGGMEISQAPKDTTSNTFHIRSIMQLVKMSQGAPTGGLRFDWKYYPHDDHGSVPLITEYDALRFIYDFFRPPDMNDQDKVTPDFVNSHYKNISEKMGYPLLPPESMVNSAGYLFLDRKLYDKSFGFFKMNVENYPKSSNVYDSMGDYYAAKSEKTEAIKYFTKALTLQEVPATRKKLEALTGKGK